MFPARGIGRRTVQVVLAAVVALALAPSIDGGVATADPSPVVAAAQGCPPACPEPDPNQGPCGPQPCRDPDLSGVCGGEPCPDAPAQGPCGDQPCAPAPTGSPCGPGGCPAPSELPQPAPPEPLADRAPAEGAGADTPDATTTTQVGPTTSVGATTTTTVPTPAEPRAERTSAFRDGLAAAGLVLLALAGGGWLLRRRGRSAAGG